MSVKIEFADKCKNCMLADLELEGEQLSSSNGDYIRLWNLRCKHEEVCEKWDNMLGAAMRNSD